MPVAGSIKGRPAMSEERLARLERDLDRLVEKSEEERQRMLQRFQSLEGRQHEMQTQHAVMMTTLSHINENVAGLKSGVSRLGWLFAAAFITAFVGWILNGGLLGFG